MQASLLQKLGIIDCAVLIVNNDNTFTLIHANNNWFPSILPDLNLGETKILENPPAYLEDFFFDAEEFWNLNVEGSIDSGIWSEQTSAGLWRLEASAITHENVHYLVLNNLEHEHKKQQNTLQVARELLISNDTILEKHELVHKRIESLTSNHHQINIDDPVKQLMDSAEFGIAIIDSNMQAIEQNLALFQLFDVKKEATVQPIELMLALCHRQFPEFQRVIDTQEKWSGQIYWVKPDKFSRWLQLSICPVKDKSNQFNYWLFMLTDVSREKYLQQSNEELTYFDVMTKLPNRQYFSNCVESAIERKAPFYILQINIKHLKRINEVYGYSVGDDVIKSVISRLNSKLKDKAILARLGGNEFAMILYESDQKGCERFANDLISCACEPVEIVELQKCKIAIHIGAVHYPDDESIAEDLMRHADLTAYFGKNQSGSVLYFYSEELKELSIQRIELEIALRLAVEENQFELFLQPINNIDTGQVIKAEALIRWNRPNVGIVPPDLFIPVAEQNGLIIAIGQWVVNEAIRLLEELHRKNKLITLSVNVSPAQLKNNNLLSIIQQGLAKSCINVAPFLELELTEGVLVDDFAKIQIFLEAVRALGITIAIDDFGTGYSSLSYLQKLPIDHLKIDRSFIQDLTTSENNGALVLAVLAMAKSLKLGVIAEGVETEEQLEFLKVHHCQSAQGYYFSRPIPFDEFISVSDNWLVPGK